MTPRPGHAPRGEQHYLSSLTEDDVRLIKQALAERRRLAKAARELSNRQLAAKMECSPQTIANIAAGRTWSHVNGSTS